MRKRKAEPTFVVQTISNFPGVSKVLIKALMKVTENNKKKVEYTFRFLPYYFASLVANSLGIELCVEFRGLGQKL
jgi:DNA polymerase elongation subunit (family B)